MSPWGWWAVGRLADEVKRRWLTPPAPPTPPAIAALGLRWPCSRADVDRACRRLARLVHPDAGGSHTSFLQLGQLRERARAAVAAHEAKGTR